MNPTLSDLVGGIESVTLSDEEARRRGTQKSVLERKAPPTFSVLIEIQDRQRMVIHHDVGASVDALLRGRPLMPELRYIDEKGDLHVERVSEPPRPGQMPDQGGDRGGRRRRDRDYGDRDYAGSGEPSGYSNSRGFGDMRGGEPRGYADARAEPRSYRDSRSPAAMAERGPRNDLADTDWSRVGEVAGDVADARPEGAEPPPAGKPVRIYPYGIGQNRLRSAAASLNVPVVIVDNLNAADVVMTLKNYYRQQPQPLVDAERRGVPIYILRSNTVTQMEQSLANIFHMPTDPIDVFTEAMRETQEGIQRVLNGSSDAELAPRSAAIRSQQHQLARAANLISHSYGREPYRRVRIFRK
jgi:hypothetical protein